MRTLARWLALVLSDFCSPSTFGWNCECSTSSTRRLAFRVIGLQFGHCGEQGVARFHQRFQYGVPGEESVRVAHVLVGRCNPESANGVDKTVYHLARYQAIQNADVAVFSLTDKEPLPIAGVEARVVRPPLGGRFGARLPLTPKALLEGLLAWAPDIVHFHSVHIGPFIALARTLKRLDVPYVVTPNGGFAPGRLARVTTSVRAYVRLLEKTYLEGARFVQAVSRNDAEGLRTLGIRARITEVPNGIDLSAIPQEVDVGLLRRRYPNLEGRRIFLFLGRLAAEHKGLDLLVDGFSRAGTKDAALVLVGPDWRRNLTRLQGRADAPGLREKVVFTGPAYGMEKWHYLAGADIFVHTSRWEGFAFSVLEALAMGKPVLASPAADPEGKIGTRGVALTVPPTVDDIAKAIWNLGRIPVQELVLMGRQARALAEEYDWKQISRRLLEAYVT